MSISVQNIAARTSLHYLLSNNHVDQLLGCPFLTDCDNGVRDWCATLLNALSVRLNDETVQFFSTRRKDKRTTWASYSTHTHRRSAAAKSRW